jgi:hypothetical protein
LLAEPAVVAAEANPHDATLPASTPCKNPRRRRSASDDGGQFGNFSIVVVCRTVLLTTEDSEGREAETSRD